MSVRMLRAWNGHAEGDIVNFGATEEARLISLGIAGTPQNIALSPQSSSGPLAIRPTAAAFGIGVWQDGATLYVSDGVSWTKQSDSIKYALSADDDFLNASAVQGKLPAVGLPWVMSGTNAGQFAIHTEGYLYNANTTSGLTSYAILQAAAPIHKITHTCKSSHVVIPFIENYPVNGFGEMLHLQITPTSCSMQYWTGGLVSQTTNLTYLTGINPITAGGTYYDSALVHDFTAEIIGNVLLVSIDGVAIYAFQIAAQTLVNLLTTSTGTFFETFGDTDGARLYAIKMYSRVSSADKTSVDINYLKSSETATGILHVGNPKATLFNPKSSNYHFVDLTGNSNEEHNFESSGRTVLRVASRAAGNNAELNLTSYGGNAQSFKFTSLNNAGGTIGAGTNSTERLRFGVQNGINVGATLVRAVSVPTINGVVGGVAGDLWIDISTTPPTLRVV